AALPPHVFGRFRPGFTGTTRQHGGLGLGLAIVRHLVELHGGTVRAENNSGGSGAVFFVVLPAETADREDPAASRPALVGAPQQPTARLDGLAALVTDDD